MTGLDSAAARQPPEASGRAAALHRLLDVLRCPLCRGELSAAPAVLRCRRRHTFNVAKQGYASLLPAPPPGGDTAGMVDHRGRFLAAGHYAPLAAAVARLVERDHRGAELVLDAGVGTGYYLSAVLDALAGARGLGMDTSKYALRRAARAHPRAAAVAGDVWQGLPVRSGAASVVLSVFSPRNAAEFRRVLRADGALVLVRPSPRHLAELRDPLGLLSVDPDKERRLRAGLAQHFDERHHQELEYPMRLDSEHALDLALMGPSAHHAVAGELGQRLRELGPAAGTVTASFVLTTFAPR